MKSLTIWVLGVLLFFRGFTQQHDQMISITPLTDNIFVHTSYKILNGTPFPSNGLFIITDSGTVLIDTPWDTVQTRQLLDSLQNHYNTSVVLCISTHFHDDRTAGLGILRSLGAKTYASVLTDQLSSRRGEQRPEFTFTGDTSFRVGNMYFSTYYPGKGHSPDNIVVWIPSSRVLFGGCLIKSTDAAGIGNTADADLDSWRQAIRRIKSKFPDARYIIPGHQGWLNKKALQHTLDLLK